MFVLGSNAEHIVVSRVSPKTLFLGVIGHAREFRPKPLDTCQRCTSQLQLQDTP